MSGPAPQDVQLDHGSDRALRRALVELLDEASRDGHRLDTELRELAKSYEGSVYNELIQQLTSLELAAEEGAGSWQAINAHQRSMEERLGKAVDIRVAMLDWFLESRALREPRIVELSTFEQLQASAHRDELTGLHNYRFFKEHLRREVAKSSRRLTPLSLAMIDVDDFKAYNDTYGHEAGNQVLIAVARALTTSLRQDDICARYGGEEFVLVLSDTAKPAAKDVAERTRVKVEQSCGDFADVKLPKIPTISLGVATYPADGVEAGTLLEHADQALYAAKSNGKNQVRVYGGVTRSYRRADVFLEGRYRTLESGYESFDTSSIGEGGFCIRVGQELTTGSLIEISLRVPGQPEDLTVTGRVVYVRPKPPDYEAGIAIAEIAANDRVELGRLLEESDGRPDKVRVVGA